MLGGLLCWGFNVTCGCCFKPSWGRPVITEGLRGPRLMHNSRCGQQHLLPPCPSLLSLLALMDRATGAAALCTVLPGYSKAMVAETPG